MRLAVIDPEKCVGCQCCMFACTRIHQDAGLGKSCIGIKSAGGMQHGFLLVVCRACDDPPCARACPEDALVLRKGGGVLLKSEKCTGCGICRQACVLARYSGTRRTRNRSSAGIVVIARSIAHIPLLTWTKTRKPRRKPMLKNDPLRNVLYIDLTKKSFRITDRSDLFETYLGGAGVASQLLMEECPEGAEPLGPYNPIIMAVGPLTSLYPLASKTVAMFKSPHTGNLGESHAGGRSAVFDTHGGLWRNCHQRSE